MAGKKTIIMKEISAYILRKKGGYYLGPRMTFTPFIHEALFLENIERVKEYLKIVKKIWGQFDWVVSIVDIKDSEIDPFKEIKKGEEDAKI